jgi:prepilin-type N-terminal cleavage/methylation domain-containing protein
MLRKRAFTLVELLVVITIIVGLLAMLSPALDQAIYQAQLATCAARINGHMHGATLYTMDYKRAYPSRNFPAASHPWIVGLKNRTQTNQWFDVRPAIYPYVRPKFFLDPLCSEKVDLEIGADEIQTTVASTYVAWWGIRYTNPTFGGKGALKLGQPFEFGRFPDTSNDPATVVKESYNVLVADQDWIGGVLTVGSHPDYGRRPLMVAALEWHNDPLLAGPEGMAISMGAGYNFNMARWGQTAPFEGKPNVRELIDANYGFNDGSVKRYNGVYYNAAEFGHPNSAFRKVGAVAHEAGPGVRNGLAPGDGAYMQVPFN